MMHKLLLSVFTLIAFNFFSQHFSFSTYGETEGINQPYIYDIKQDEEGFLCFTTSEGAFKYDGTSFERIDGDGKVNEPFFKSILTADQFVLLGSNNGLVYVYLQGKKMYAFEDKKNATPIVDLFKKNNAYYALHQNGQINEYKIDISSKIFELKRKIYLPKNQIYNSIIEYKNEYVAYGSEGIHTFIIDDNRLLVKETHKVNNDEITSALDLNGSLILGTASSGLYKFKDNKVSKINIDSKIANASIKSISKNGLTSFWVSVFEQGLFEIKKNTENENFYIRTTLSVNNGLPSDFINKVFVDRESNLWLGTYGQGISKLNSKFFVHYELEKYGMGKTVYSVFNTDKLYFGMRDGILEMNILKDSISVWKYTSSLPDSKVKSIFKDPNSKNIYIGTEDKGLYLFNKETKRTQKIKLSNDNLSDFINHLSLHNNNLYVSTLNGLYVYNINSKEIKNYNTSDGLPHNSIYSTFVRSDGKILISVLANAIYYLENDKIGQLKIKNPFGSLDIVTFQEDRKGAVWIATNGQGLFKLDKNKIERFNSYDGLHSDYIYQIAIDKKNMIWCAHRGGLSRLSSDASQITTFDYRNDVAMDFSLNAIAADQFGNLWFGANNGLIEYAIAQDKFVDYNPKPVYQYSTVNDTMNIGHKEIELEYRRNKIKIYFRTVSLSNSDGVYYQYRLKGLDNKWSEPSKENSATFNQLLDGEYTLEVRSKIGNGEWSKISKILVINVPEPIWKKWWFSLLGIAIIIVLIIFTMNFRTKNLIGQKKKLEEVLSQRTAEIEYQKNQIKLQYLETQDSIDYAVKIQTALLPKASRLEKIVPDSFILYKPKDKVSGDFYYFEQFENRLVIAACDATGHGVPGAFISLIGFVTMKEILHRASVDAPNQVLSELDFEINNTLEQFDRPNDGREGMDVSICEIDLDTLEVKMASALRPIWILKDNQIEKIRFSKASIGGGYDYEKNAKKEFVAIDKKLNKGDAIYMFSDGYIDQFGGPRNKKLMSKRMQEIIRENSHLPMNEQHDVLLKYLNDWKGDFDQTDDIMVIGIRL